MRQAFHILRKDVTHLWPQITIVVLLAAAFAFSNIQSREASAIANSQLWFLAYLLGVLVPAAYAWLIVTLVHQEALPGDRQFWLTRPYRLGSLLAAKAMFVVIFVSLTMAAKDCFIAAAQGFPVLSYLPGLLLRQLAWTAWVVLPALAAGAVTRNLQEVGLAGAGVALVYALQGVLFRKSFWPGVEWVRDYLGMLLLVAVCGAIVLRQYWRRETAQARIAVACCAILVLAGLPLLPWTGAFAVQMLVRRPRIDSSQVQVTADLSRAPSATPVSGIPPGPVAIALPLRLAGVPRGMTIAADGTRVVIIAGQHEVWRSGWQQNWYGVKTEQYRWQVVNVDSDPFRSVRDHPVTVKLSLGLTLLEDQPPILVPAHQRKFAYAGSRCEDPSPRSHPPPIWCLAALRAPPRTLVGLEAPGTSVTISQVGSWSYAPYEALLDLSPLAATNLPIFSNPASAVDPRPIWERPDAQIRLTPQRPVAHFRRELEFPGVRLANYVLPPGRFVGFTP